MEVCESSSMYRTKMVQQLNLEQSQGFYGKGIKSLATLLNSVGALSCPSHTTSLLIDKGLHKIEMSEHFVYTLYARVKPFLVYFFFLEKCENKLSIYL